MTRLNSYSCRGRCGARVLVDGALCGVCQPMPAPRALKAATLLASPVTTGTPLRDRVPQLRPLTARQYETLGYIRDYVADHGYAPTLEEIAIAVGVHSMALAHDDLQALQRHGRLTLDRASPRGITLTAAGVA